MILVLYLFIIFAPMFNAYGMNSHDDWRSQRELLKSDDTTIVLDSDIESYDPNDPGDTSGAIPPKTTDGMNDDTHKAAAHDATADSDNESYSDETHALVKSRGARKRVGYQHYERGQYEKQKQNSVSRKKRSKARKKKIDKAEYAALKAQELRDLNKQLLKSNEHRDLKNDGASEPDSSQHTSIDHEAKPVPTSKKKEPTSPHVFKLLAQLDHGTVPAALIEFFNGDNEDTSIDISHDEYNARSALYRSLLERYKAATGKFPANYSFELCKKFDAFYPFWDNCGTMLEELHTMENDANRSSFLESFRVAVAATRHHALSLGKLLKEFNTTRDFAKKPLSTGNDLGPDQAPFDTDTTRALDRFPRNLMRASKADINFVRNNMYEHELEFKEDTTFKKFLAAFVVKLDQHMPLEKAEKQLHADKNNADHDFDAAYDLAKSRGARKRTGYHKHERDQHRQKKQNTHAKKHARQARKEKTHYADLQAAQLVDAKKNLLKPSKYASLKNETTPDDDQVTDLAESLNSLSLASENDSASSTSSNGDSATCEVSSDYVTCHNPECTDKMARICCKCAYGKRLRHAYHQLYGFDAFNDSDAPSDSDREGSDGSGLYFGASYDGSISDMDISSGSSRSNSDTGSYSGSSTSCGRDIVLDHATFAHMCYDDFKELRDENLTSELIALDELTFLEMSLEEYRQAQKRGNTRWIYSPESLTNFYFALAEKVKEAPIASSSSGSSTPSNSNIASDDYRNIILDEDEFLKGREDGFDALRTWYQEVCPELNLVVLDNHTFERMSLEDYQQARKDDTTGWVFSARSLVGFLFALANEEENERNGALPVEQEAESTTSADNSFAPMAPEQFLTLFGNSLDQDGSMTMEKFRERFNAVLDIMNVGSGDEPATLSLDYDTREHLNDLSYLLSQATDDEIDSALYHAGMTLRGNKAPLFSTYLIAFARELDSIDTQARTQEALIRKQEEQEQITAYHARHSNIPDEQDEDFDAAWHLSKSRGARKRK